MLTTSGDRVENCSVIDWTIKIYTSYAYRVVSSQWNNNKVSKNIGICFSAVYTSIAIQLRHFMVTVLRRWSDRFMSVQLSLDIMGCVLGIPWWIKKSWYCESLSLRCNQFWLPPVFPSWVLNVFMDKLRLLQWYSCLQKSRLIKKLELIV